MVPAPLLLAVLFAHGYVSIRSQCLQNQRRAQSLTATCQTSKTSEEKQRELQRQFRARSPRNKAPGVHDATAARFAGLTTGSPLMATAFVPTRETRTTATNMTGDTSHITIAAEKPEQQGSQAAQPKPRCPA